MHNNLVSFLDTNNIITNHQFGFRSGLSTFLVLNQLYDHILRPMNLDNTHVAFFLI